jgi:SAM-dependent methyltransferase
MPDPPIAFIGSSTEGGPIAEAIQQNLYEVCESNIWFQGVFAPGNSTLESLVSQLDLYDFAILVFTPDDDMNRRGAASLIPRDNVLVELGLFIGSLGRHRTFVVHQRHSGITIPSDLAGVTLAPYVLPAHSTLQAALGPACAQIRNVIRSQGRRQRPSVQAVLPPSPPPADIQAAQVAISQRVESAGDILGADAEPPGLDLWYKQLRPLLHQTPTYTTPTYFLDSNLNIIDWNIAFELIFAEITPTLQYRHVNELIARLANYESVFDHGREFTRKVHDGKLPLVDTERLVYRSRRYGDICMLKIATQLHESEGNIRGWAVALLPQTLDWPLFQSDIHERIQNDKMWSIYAASYDKVLTDFPPYQKLLQDVASVVPGTAASAIDAGAGSGNSTRVLLDKGLRVTSVESNAAMIERMRDKRFDASQHRIIKASVEFLNTLRTLQSGSFDAAISVNVLYSLDDPYACLTGLNRVLRPKGVLGFSTTHSEVHLDPLLAKIKEHLENRQELDDLAEDYERVHEINKRIENDIAKRHTADWYCDITESAGFEIVRREDFTYEGAVMLVHARKR